MSTIDEKIRLAAFDWLKIQTPLHDGTLDINLLRKGFEFGNERISLVAPQGIFKPKLMNLPLTITTAPKSRYEDALRSDGLFNYKYRGENINSWDNVGLRECMKQRIPIIYFLGLVPSKYLPIWPAYIIADQPENLTFIVKSEMFEGVIREEYRVYERDMAKQYANSSIRIRIHQKAFRERVLHAYRTQCSICRLRHSELLDAAHIIPDSDSQSAPSVDNGIALCKIHHAAFDKYFIGITPDYKVEVRKDVLEEEDGPMLQHGLKELHNSKIYIPKLVVNRPNRDYLDIRYQKYLNAI